MMPPLTLSGIADEAAAPIESQIRCHRALGWQHMELRSVDGIALAALPEARRASVCAALREARFAVPVLASQIGNWNTSIAQPFAADVAELDILLEIAAELGSSMIRVMSYPNAGLSDTAWSAEVLVRLRRLSAQAARQGVSLIHENCAGWGGQSAAHTLRLVAGVGHENFKLLFDVGNGLSYGYAALDFLRQVWPHVAHVHLKDGRGSGKQVSYTLPGEGDAGVAQCVQFLHEHGYRGSYVIEPHLNLIPHLQQQYGNPNDSAQSMQQNYLRYAAHTAALLESILGVPAPMAATSQQEACAHAV